MCKVIYGDGIRDDTPAVQAFMNGEDVCWEDGTKFDGTLRDKQLKITEEINVHSEAYLKGREARRMGKSISYNPYRHKGTAQEFTEWQRGWKDEQMQRKSL